MRIEMLTNVDVKYLKHEIEHTGRTTIKNVK